jgi:hypothetical protein
MRFTAATAIDLIPHPVLQLTLRVSAAATVTHITWYAITAVGKLQSTDTS